MAYDDHDYEGLGGIGGPPWVHSVDCWCQPPDTHRPNEGAQLGCADPLGCAMPGVCLGQLVCPMRWHGA